MKGLEENQEYLNGDKSQSEIFEEYSVLPEMSMCNALNKTDLICAIDYTRTDESRCVNDALWMSE